MIQEPQASPSSPPQAPPSHAPSSFSHQDQSTPQARQRARRRVSDRVRSPSESSGTSSDDEEAPLRDRLLRQSSEPVGRMAFPVAPNAIDASAGIVYPQRKKTLSDSSRTESPIPLRSSRGGTAPPSSFGGFARPVPASRRRRGSQSDTEERTPESNSGRAGRRVSSQSVNTSLTSPTWSARGESVPSSPMSPGIDSNSFHFRAKSPEEIDQEEHEAAETQLEQEREQEDVETNEEVEETDDAVGMLGTGSEALHPRLSRISVSLPTHSTLTRLTRRPNPPTLCGPPTTSCKHCRSRTLICRESLRSRNDNLLS